MIFYIEFFDKKLPTIIEPITLNHVLVINCVLLLFKLIFWIFNDIYKSLYLNNTKNYQIDKKSLNSLLNSSSGNFGVLF
jgi:hypothetical protein